MHTRLSLGLLVLEFGGHLLGRAQVDGDQFVLHLLVLDYLAEFGERRRQGDGERAGARPAVAHVRVALERRARLVTAQDGRRDRCVSHDYHREHSRVYQVLTFQFPSY